MIQCKHCGRRNSSSKDVARVEGWRLFAGKSLTGKDLDDVICPWCAGTAEDDDKSWRVRCQTCDWEYEEEDGEGPLEAQDAYHVAHDHECEPIVEIQRPGDDKWLPRRMLRKDGSLVEEEGGRIKVTAGSPP